MVLILGWVGLGFLRNHCPHPLTLCYMNLLSVPGKWELICVHGPCSLSVPGSSAVLIRSSCHTLQVWGPNDSELLPPLPQTRKLSYFHFCCSDKKKRKPDKKHLRGEKILFQLTIPGYSPSQHTAGALSTRHIHSPEKRTMKLLVCLCSTLFLHCDTSQDPLPRG